MTERVTKSGRRLSESYDEQGNLLPVCTGTASAIHNPYDDSWWEYDARGYALCRVCEHCKDAKLARYRPDVLTDSQYEADEPFEEE